MTRTRIEEFLGDLNYELMHFVKKNTFANDADIFTFVEKSVKEALANDIGNNPELLFAVVNPERSEEKVDYKGTSLMAFTCQQVPLDEILVVRLRGSAESLLDRQPGATDDEMVMCIDFEEVETLKLKEAK